MKGTIITLAILLSLCAQMQARTLSPAQALAAAQSQAATHHISIPELEAVAPALTLANEDGSEPTLYVVTSGRNREGFVVVAADDAVSPLLGYSDSGTFSEKDMPANFRWWLEEYGRQIEWARSHPSGDVVTREATPAAGYEAVAPLIKTNWNQGAPYNLLCPVTSDGQAVTGCVATVMAQIKGETSIGVSYFRKARKHAVE